MSDSNIQPGVSSTWGTTPTIGENLAQLRGMIQKQVFWDQLSQSDQEAVMQAILTAQFPLLVPPQETNEINRESSSISSAEGTSGKMQLQLAKQQHEVIMSMLESWSKNIQEQAEMSEKAEERRSLERMANMYQLNKKEIQKEQDATFPIFTMGLMLTGVMGMQHVMMPTIDAASIGINPIADMSAAAMLPKLGDMRAELGLIGAIYAAGIQYFTVAQLATESTNKSTSPKPGDFAKGFAENVISLLGNAEFNHYLLAIVTQTTQKNEKLTPEKQQELVSTVKLVLLSSALAMLYKVEAGKMTSIEFAAMVKGEITFEKGSLQHTLVGLIRNMLDNMSPKMRELVTLSLLEYFDKDPAIENLANPAKVFGGMYETLPSRDFSV